MFKTASRLLTPERFSNFTDQLVNQRFSVDDSRQTTLRNSILMANEVNIDI